MIKPFLSTLVLTGFVLASAAFAQPESGCPADFAGYLPARLAVGLIAEIDAAGTPNRLRETPGRDGAYLGDITPGSRFPVVEGPACSDGIVWWRVAHEGVLGWTAESNVAERMYYLRLAPGDVQPQPTATPDGFPLHAAARAAIGFGNLEVLAALPYPALPAVHIAAASEAPVLALATSDGVIDLYNSAQPERPLASLTMPGPVYALALDPTGTLIAIGWLDVGAGRYRAELWRFDAFNSEPLLTAAPPLDLFAELPLQGIAVRPPHVVTLHGVSGTAPEQNRGAVMFWDTRSAAAAGRIELDFLPVQAVFDATGAALVVSAISSASTAQTLVIDMNTLAPAQSLPDYGVLALRHVEGDAVTRLYAGLVDGRLASYDLGLPGALVPTPSGEAVDVSREVVPVFQPVGDVPVAVTALAVSPDQALVAAGSGLVFDGAQPDGYVTTVRFLEAASGRGQSARLTLPEARGILALAFSADGTTLLVHYADALGAPFVRAYGLLG
jgi:hypothetical protein